MGSLRLEIYPASIGPVKSEFEDADLGVRVVNVEGIPLVVFTFIFEYNGKGPYGKWASLTW